MADVERVKVIFRKVTVLKNPDFLSAGDFKFTARVDGQPVGNPNQLFKGRRGAVFNLPAAQWSKVIDVTNKNQFPITFRGIDEDGFLNGADDDVGTVSRLVRRPYNQEVARRQATPFFLLEYDIEVPVDGRFGRHLPGEIVAARVVPGGLDATTIATSRVFVRAEAHQVVPVPTGAAAPQRPPLAAGVQEDANNEVAKTVTPTSPINLLPNPAVIPILPAAQAGLPAAQQQAFAARIELTRFRPRTLAFTDNDPRLKWTFRPTVGGATVNFLGRTEGAKIFVTGLTPGEGIFECRLAREILCTYRVLVAAHKQIPCRVNIIDGINPVKGGPLISPQSSPAHIQLHLQVVNIFLRQMALELVLDTNATIQNKGGLTVTATPTAGIFRVRAPIGRTRNASTNSTDFITLVNRRPNVFNFAYIISDRDGNLGAGDHFPNSTIAPPAPNARPLVSEPPAKVPTSSWVKPCGVAPEGNPPNPVQLVLIRQRLPGQGNNTFAMHVTDANVSGGGAGSNASAQTFGNTIVHELGHCLNLGHRVEGTNNNHATPGVDAPAGTPNNQMSANGIFFDGLTHPPSENVMHWIAPATIAHDFDILQAIGARASRLVPP